MTEEKKRVNTTMIRNVIGVVLSVSMIALTVYVLQLWNANYQSLLASSQMQSQVIERTTENYRHINRELQLTKSALDLSKIQLGRVQQEFAVIQEQLSKTEATLAEVRMDNDSMVQELLSMREGGFSADSGKVEALENTIALLQKENEKYRAQLTAAQERSQTFSADIRSTAEGRKAVRELRKQLSVIKNRMRAIARQADLAKAVAQKERDRIETMIGNNGFLVKDGKAVLPKDIPATASKVNIDVKFVE